MQTKSLILDSFIKYTLACVIIFVTLFPKFPFLDVPGTFVSIRIEDLFLAFGAILLVFKFLSEPNVFLKFSLNKAIALFLIVAFVSYLSGTFLTQSVVPHIGFLHFARRIEYLIPLYLAWISVKNNKSNLDFYLNVLIFVVILVFIYGYGQKYLDWPIIITQNEEYSKGVALRYIPGSHINSTFAGHYDLATFLVLALPVLITVAIFVNGYFYKLLMVASWCMGLWLLVHTASRISLVSYIIAVTCSLFFVRKYLFIPFVIFVSLLFTMFSENLVARYQRIIDVATQKLSQVSNLEVLAANGDSLPERRQISTTPTPTPVFEDRSTNIRLNVEWPRALRAFTKNPFLGTGYSSITLATDNDYLRLLGEVGILGFLSFMLIFLKLALIFLEKFPITHYLQGVNLALVAGVFGAIPGILTNALFIDVFEASKFAIMFWMFVGFCVAILDDAKFKKTN